MLSNEVTLCTAEHTAHEINVSASSLNSAPGSLLTPALGDFILRANVIAASEGGCVCVEPSFDEAQFSCC